MSENYKPQNAVSVKVPRSIYDFYFKAHLFEEYSSFAEWVRSAMRKDRERWSNKMALEQYTKRTPGEKIQEEFDKQWKTT